MHHFQNLAKFVALAITLSLFVSISGGWGRDGHSIVAEIAWRELSPEARKEIKALLGDSSLAEVSSWADTVRREDDYRWSAPLHYVNLPIDASEYNSKRDCPAEGCVVSAIEHFAGVLKDRSNTPQERGEALMFLVHFVGDLHQPMHAGRAEDRGGNSIDLTFLGEETNLHQIWDSGILNASSNESWIDRTERLYGDINDTDKLTWLAGTADNDWQATAGRWAFESHNIAEQHAYILAPNSQVGDEYVSKSAPIAELRLSQAGIRLASVLEECLGKGSTDTDGSTDR
jgi:hypothetical protein